MTHPPGQVPSSPPGKGGGHEPTGPGRIPPKPTGNPGSKPPKRYHNVDQLADVSRPLTVQNGRYRYV